MDVNQEKRHLRDRYFQAMLDAILPLKNGPDAEVSLEALIEASEQLTEHLVNELTELRVEQAD